MRQMNTSSPEESLGRAPANRPCAILVADDDWVVADSLAMILNHRGYKASPVYSGEEAVKAAAEVRPDYLLSDVFMHAMNGIDAARLICEQVPDCKVILFSGHIEAEELVCESRGAGAARDFLHKPFRPEVLLRRLQEDM